MRRLLLLPSLLATVLLDTHNRELLLQMAAMHCTEGSCSLLRFALLLLLLLLLLPLLHTHNSELLLKIAAMLRALY
jgi:hypothetical protein